MLEGVDGGVSEPSLLRHANLSDKNFMTGLTGFIFVVIFLPVFICSGFASIFQNTQFRQVIFG